MKKHPNGEGSSVQLRVDSTAYTHFIIFGRLFLPYGYLAATRALCNIFVNFVRFVLDPSTPSTFLICGIRCSLFCFTTHKSHDWRCLSTSDVVIVVVDWPNKNKERFHKKPKKTCSETLDCCDSILHTKPYRHDEQHKQSNNALLTVRSVELSFLFIHEKEWAFCRIDILTMVFFSFPAVSLRQNLKVGLARLLSVGISFNRSEFFTRYCKGG